MHLQRQCSPPSAHHTLDTPRLSTSAPVKRAFSSVTAILASLRPAGPAERSAGQAAHPLSPRSLPLAFRATATRSSAASKRDKRLESICKLNKVVQRLCDQLLLAAMRCVLATIMCFEALKCASLCGTPHAELLSSQQSAAYADHAVLRQQRFASNTSGTTGCVKC